MVQFTLCNSLPRAPAHQHQRSGPFLQLIRGSGRMARYQQAFSFCQTLWGWWDLKDCPLQGVGSCFLLKVPWKAPLTLSGDDWFLLTVFFCFVLDSLLWPVLEKMQMYPNFQVQTHQMGNVKWGTHPVRWLLRLWLLLVLVLLWNFCCLTEASCSALFQRCFV